MTLLQPSVRRLSGSSARARHRLKAKWCVPGLLSGCQRVDLYAEVELSSILLSGLGGDTSNSPASGGGGTEVLDFFFSFSFRVLSVTCEGSFSNIWFFRESDEKGPHCNLYLPRVF